VYDYWLGGTHNFLADQDAGRAVVAADPNMREMARANRAFLGRAVRFLAAQGIRQYLDIGSGIPTQGNVHEIAQQAAPGSRVVYVDIDPVAVAHSRAILAGIQDAGIIEADLREPQKILAHSVTRSLVDFDQPAGLLLSAVLHFVGHDEDPWRLTRTLRDALPAGSYLVISHGTDEAVDAEAAGKVYTWAGSRVWSAWPASPDYDLRSSRYAVRRVVGPGGGVRPLARHAARPGRA
jgi:hypothetical protein